MNWGGGRGGDFVIKKNTHGELTFCPLEAGLDQHQGSEQFLTGPRQIYCCRSCECRVGSRNINQSTFQTVNQPINQSINYYLSILILLNMRI